MRHALPRRKRTVGGILRTPEGKIDYTQDFFEKASYLTVSGQLNAEYYACALSNVYTFGPTFRSVVEEVSSSGQNDEGSVYWIMSRLHASWGAASHLLNLYLYRQPSRCEALSSRGCLEVLSTGDCQ